MPTKKKVKAIYTYDDSEAGLQKEKFNSFETIKKYINEFGPYGDSDGIVYKNGNNFWEYESKVGKEIIWKPVLKKKVGAKAAKSKLAKNKTVGKIVKKKTVNKAAKKKTIKQTGSSNKLYDKRVQAKKPGKRISKKGNKYTENRANRSDKGRLLGVKINIIDKFYALNKYKECIYNLQKYEKVILFFKKQVPIIKDKNKKLELKKELIYSQKVLAEIKTHARELKKLL